MVASPLARLVAATRAGGEKVLRFAGEKPLHAMAGGAAIGATAGVAQYAMSGDDAAPPADDGRKIVAFNMQSEEGKRAAALAKRVMGRAGTPTNDGNMVYSMDPQQLKTFMAELEKTAEISHKPKT